MRLVLAPGARGAEIVSQFEMPRSRCPVRDAPFVVDSGRYAGAFGEGEATPYRDGIRRTIDWYRSNHEIGTARKA